MTHTATPWRVFKSKDGTKLVGIGGKDGMGILDAGFGVWAWDDPEGIANAELVVRAVNSHEKLVNALKSARTMLKAYGSEYDPCHVALMDDIDAALMSDNQKSEAR